jgi:dTDP-4-dehydrorhamnose reductase
LDTHSRLQSPPYEVNDEPDPLQSYGRQKRDGEIAVLAEQEKGAKATVLRVPILYGRVEYNAESAVNLLQDGENLSQLHDRPHPLPLSLAPVFSLPLQVNSSCFCRFVTIVSSR